MVSKYFLPFYKLLFYFVNCFFHSAEDFRFEGVPLVDFLLCCLYFWCHKQKIATKINDKELLPCAFFYSFMVSSLMFKSLIHSKFIFVSGVR